MHCGYANSQYQEHIPKETPKTFKISSFETNPWRVWDKKLSTQQFSSDTKKNSRPADFALFLSNFYCL